MVQIHQLKDNFITILNVYTHNNRAPKYVRQNLIELQGEMDEFTIIETSTPLSK